MTEIKKAYTRAGDGGYTKTLKNVRISKADAVIELLGTLEEAYAEAISVQLSSGSACAGVIAEKIMTAKSEIEGGGVAVTPDSVAALEKAADELAGEITFEKPTNTASAAMYKTYTLLRRAERMTVKAGQFGRFGRNMLAYMNRLCSYALAAAQALEAEDGSSALQKPKTKSAPKEITVNKDDVKMTPASDTQKAVNLSLAKEIAMAVENMAADRGKNVVIAVLDEGANPVLIHAMDNSYIASVDIALNKAYTAVSLKMPTHEALELSEEGGPLHGLTNGGRILLLGGGFPLIKDGKVCGGIAVSGSTATEDTEFAEFGAKYFEVKYSR